MGNKEKAQFIDLFLKALYEASFATSLATGLEMRQVPSKENKQKFKTIEFLLEDLDLVELVNGRDNSTIGGQCEYFISSKGRELVEKNKSSLSLIEQVEFFDEKINEAKNQNSELAESLDPNNWE